METKLRTGRIHRFENAVVIVFCERERGSGEQSRRVLLCLDTCCIDGSHRNDRIIELEKMKTVSNFKIWIWGKCKERGTGGAHDGWDGKGLVAKHSQRAAGIQNKSRQTRVSTIVENDPKHCGYPVVYLAQEYHSQILNQNRDASEVFSPTQIRMPGR